MEAYLVRVPPTLDVKELDGLEVVVDYENEDEGMYESKQANSSIAYECGPTNASIKLMTDKTDVRERKKEQKRKLRYDPTITFCGQISFRRHLVPSAATSDISQSDSKPLKILPKRHLLQPIDSLVHHPKSEVKRTC